MNTKRLGYSTNELGEIINRSPHTIRTRLSRFGHFYGIKPKKLVSGQLIWPLDSPERLTQEEGE
ncbi:MAG: monooxygenase [Chromatiaceae bacterium]|nr:monooxygenase [Chromatiaceae bacterium]MCF7993864.1 monooxygenase [Chromatiaceae bacterium]